MSLDAAFMRLYNSISVRRRTAFVSAFAGGLLIHLFRLTNHLMTWDSAYNFHDSQDVLHLGRCFLSLGCGISSYYDIQWFNGLLSLVYLGLSCALIADILDIKSRVNTVLTALVLVSFPSVAGTFAYMYTADGYFLAMLLAVAAVHVSAQVHSAADPHGVRPVLAGAILLAFSAGMYQSYLSLAVMLILARTILAAAEGKKSVRLLLTDWLRFAVMGITGCALYLAACRLRQLIEGVEAADYNGMTSLSLFGGRGAVYAVKNCLIDFVYFFFGPLESLNLFKLLNIVLWPVLAVLVLKLLSGFIVRRDCGRLIMTLVSLIAMPLVLGMFYFISGEVRYYMLMNAGYAVIYLLPIIMTDMSCAKTAPAVQAAAASTEGSSAAGAADGSSVQAAPAYTDEVCVTRVADSADIQKPGMQLLITVLTLVTIFNFAVISNISYLYMKASNNMTFALAGRMLDRIEQLEGFEKAEKLCIIGHFEDYDRIELMLPPAMAGVRDSYFISEQAHFAKLFEDWFGLKLDNASAEETAAIETGREFAAMGSWPAADSVRLMDRTVVIKIGNDIYVR